MNVDVKIASKVIELRMKTVLPSIINYDQTAYVKNRYIGKLIKVITRPTFEIVGQTVTGNVLGY